MKAWAKTELDEPFDRLRTEPFAERVDRLARELELAIRWDRPSILLAVYRSAYVMRDAAAALAERVRGMGQAVEWVRVTGEADADVPVRLAEHPGRDGTVFFVEGLRWGSPTALRALNVRREYFVDQRLRAVFWLTEGEAVAIAREAPDFWVFRHRVVEFVEPPEAGRAATVAREFAWRGFEDRTLRQDTEAKIALREALLADLPEADETLAARAELQFTLGGLYWAGRQYERAVESFSAALEGAIRTGNERLEVWCYNGLGNVYAGLGRQEEAIAAFQRAIELDPTLAAPRNGLGAVYAGLGRQEEAIAAYRRAIELDPTDAAPHNGLGNVYADQGRQEEALAAFQRAIELDPTYAYPHNGLGNVYRDLGRQEEAIAAYRRAIELDPTDAYPHNGLGTVYRALGRQEEAIAAYQRAIELDPTLATPHNNLGDEYLQLGRLEEAEAEFQERTRLSPDDALSAEVCLGVIARHRGDNEAAARHFERALAIWDTGWQRRLQSPAGLLENKALALLGLGRPQEALAALRQALDQRLPGETIDFYIYDLLAAASESPAGLEEMMALLREAAGEELR